MLSDPSGMMFSYLLLVCVFVLLPHESSSLPSILRIGGIFNEYEIEEETAFRFAIEKINDDATILPGVTLVAHVERVSVYSSVSLEKKVCSLLNNGVAGIVGPTSEISVMHTRSICDALEIPHLEVHRDVETVSRALSINLHPRPEVLALASLDICRGLGWEDFAIVYDSNENIVLYKDILLEARSKGWNVKLYQIAFDAPVRETFVRVKKDQKTKIVIDVKPHRVKEMLRSAQQVGMFTEAQNFIITSLDLITEDLENFLYSGAKIFSLRLVEDNNPELRTLLNDWSYLGERTGKIAKEAPKSLKTGSALVYDSVKLLAMALGRLDASQSIEIRPVSCVDEVPWTYGTSVVNFMRPIIFRGLSGLVGFNEFGHRISFALDVLSIGEKGIENIGYWNSRGGLNITTAWLETYSDFAITGRHLIVTTAETEPFTMKREASVPLSGNSQFEGYAVDLIDELSLIQNFTYEIRLVKDGQYGKKREDGSWNGMIGELIAGEADIAIVDLTITKDRQAAVDFSLPFMSTGVSILYTKPEKAEPTLFGFLSPFTGLVWTCLLGSTCLMSVILFLIGRLSPYEWDNPFPCREDEPILENDLSCKNSFWCVIGALMQQGSDVAPKAFSSRLITGIWYFFTLIMVSSYTANLAAFLTIEVPNTEFNNAEELAAQTKIGYGCGAGGSTRTSFRDSPNPTLKKLSNFMESHPEMFVKNNKEGLARVMKGNYAFLMEAAQIEYVVERYCNLAQVGGLLDSKSYGIATPKDSPIRHALSKGILHLQEQGKLHILYERWWKQKRGGGRCQEAGSSGSATAMGFSNVSGVFLVLLLVAGFSIIMCFCELYWQASKFSPDWNSRWEDIKQDLAFSIKLAEYTKPNRRRKQDRQSVASSKGKKNSESGVDQEMERDGETPEPSVKMSGGRSLAELNA